MASAITTSTSVKPRTPSALAPVLDKTGRRLDTASHPQGRSLFTPLSGEPGDAPPTLFITVFIGIFTHRSRPRALRYRLALRIGCNSTPQTILAFENMHGTIDLSTPDGVVVGIPPIELSSLWACAPRRVRAPGLHRPQNRHVVGRAPSPGAPISSRIAGGDSHARKPEGLLLPASSLYA